MEKNEDKNFLNRKKKKKHSPWIDYLADVILIIDVVVIFVIVFGFVSATDLVSALQGSNLTAPLPVILLGLVSLSLLYYGSKKGTV